MTPDQKERLTNLRRAASRARKQAAQYANYIENGVGYSAEKFVSLSLDAWQKQLDELLELERELK